MKKIFYILICLFFLGNYAFSQDVKVEMYNGVEVESHYVIIKYKASLLKSFESSNNGVNYSKIMQSYMHSIGATIPEQKFTKSKMPENCDKCVDISKIYSFTYTADVPIAKVLSFLRSMPTLEYAEPNYIEHELFVPDDTETPGQWHMNTCEIYNAWDINSGDTNVVIGVTDAGFSIAHTDLVTQIKYNYADPINGFDDDFDGFTDNFRGWDFGMKDNNPDQSTASDHGTWVAGISSAKVNNGFAISGVGYKCKFLPIKVATDGGSIIRGYEGIAYAANQSCDIINVSWGSVGSFSQYAQDVINYATFNCNSLVIAAAGNNNNDGIFYPASYTNALSVGATMPGDKKWTTTSTKGSNWNYFVDVSAPSYQFKSTAPNNGTTTMWGGTSFACPIVSGVAALVKSEYPNYSALEVGERVRATCDDIYGIPENVPYVDLLGSGRVNALRALQDNTTPSVRAIDFNVTNESGQYMFYTGDTIDLSITFKNYLASATNVFITVSCESSIIAQINCDTLIPNFTNGQEITLQKPFTFKIVNTLPSDVNTYFKITYSAGSYYGYEYFPVTFNPSFYNYEVGNFKSTATADGSICILDSNVPDENGFIYKNYPNVIFEGGLCIGESADLLNANIRTYNDFTIKQFPTILPSDSTEILLYSNYETNNAQLNIDQYIYSFQDMDALIHEYRITNKTDSILTNIMAGAFIDWQMIDQEYNKMQYVDSLQLAVISTIDPYGFYTGIMPLHYHKSSIYGVDDKEDEDSLFIADGFTKDEMWYTLTHTKKVAGADFDGNTIETISSAKIGELKPDSTAVLRFALLAGDNIDAIYETAKTIHLKYKTDTTTHPHVEIGEILNPEIQVKYFNNKIYIENALNNSKIEYTLFNVLGEKYCSSNNSFTNEKGEFIIQTNTLIPGLYTLLLKNNGVQNSFKILVKD